MECTAAAVEPAITREKRHHPSCWPNRLGVCNSRQPMKGLYLPARESHQPTLRGACDVSDSMCAHILLLYRRLSCCVPHFRPLNTQQ